MFEASINMLRTSRSRGFGFVVFSQQNMVDIAQAARPHTIDGKVVDSKRATPREVSQESFHSNESGCKRVFVGGLKSTTNQALVEQYFSRFGKVIVVDMVADKVTKKQKGFAYVSFADFSAADRVSQQRFHNLDDRRVEVKLALSRAELQKQSMRGSGMEMMGNLRGGFLPDGYGHCFGNGNFGNGGNIPHPGNNMGPGPFGFEPYAAGHMGPDHMGGGFGGGRGPAGPENMDGRFEIGNGVPHGNMGQNVWSGDLGMRNSWTRPSGAWNEDPRGSSTVFPNRFPMP